MSATQTASAPLAPLTHEARAFVERHHRRDWEKRLKAAKRRRVPGLIPMPAPAPGWPNKPEHVAARARLSRRG